MTLCIGVPAIPQVLMKGRTSASAHTVQFGDIIHRFDADNLGMVSPQLPHNSQPAQYAFVITAIPGSNVGADLCVRPPSNDDTPTVIAIVCPGAATRAICVRHHRNSRF
jgi:hypothetical protein